MSLDPPQAGNLHHQARPSFAAEDTIRAEIENKNIRLLTGVYAPVKWVSSHEIMSEIFIGTNLEEDEYHLLSIKAAASGLSESALLKKLVLDCVGPVPTALPAPPQDQPGAERPDEP